MGNSGPEQDFLDSLVGTAGVDGYIGSDGITGSPGLPGSNGIEGKSAYQLWLDSGHSGSPQAFLDSLLGGTGSAGIKGLSAYELWLDVGNHGTNQQFIDSLVGVTGASGANGINGTSGQTGLSAYEIWLAQGNRGTATFFLASLIGLTGPSGATGPSGSPGPIGLTGAQGLTGQTGSIGATGAAGAAGATGATGPAGLSGLGYSASFFSTVTQNGAANSIQAMTLNSTYWQTGIALQNGSQIKILNSGHYNVAFSAQMHQTNSSGIVNFWLAKNGVAMPFTNTKMNITANSPYLVAAWNFFIDASANDYYELVWSSTSNNTEILNEPSVGTGATEHPSIPSLIVTINQVG